MMTPCLRTGFERPVRPDTRILLSAVVIKQHQGPHFRLSTRCVLVTAGRRGAESGTTSRELEAVAGMTGPTASRTLDFSTATNSASDVTSENSVTAAASMTAVAHTRCPRCPALQLRSHSRAMPQQSVGLIRAGRVDTAMSVPQMSKRDLRTT